MKREYNNIRPLVPVTLVHSYVDVLLNPARRRLVECALERDAALRDTVEAWRRQNVGLHRLAASHALPPMSQEMARDLDALQARVAHPATRRFWPIAGSIAMAAALLGGTLALALDGVPARQDPPGENFTQEPTNQFRAGTF